MTAGDRRRVRDGGAVSVLVRYAELPALPWPNGGGVTTELLSFDRSRTLSPGSLPDWRLSVATLTGPARFSRLPGLRRVFLPVGAEVTLTVNGAQRRVPDRVATTFDGDDVVDLVRLHGSAAHAVNLMYRTDAHGAVPGLTLARSDGAAARTCLVAVALENSCDAAMFDALMVDADGAPEAGMELVAVTVHDRPVDRRPDRATRWNVSPTVEG